jgi:aerobic carbon-monoxide dehydrogenase small subunit
MERVVRFSVNGEQVEVAVEPQMLLLDVLREKLGLTGAKRSCEKGDCGACTVLLDGIPVNACLVLAVDARDKKIETIEGLSDGEKLHPLQESFYNLAASQCGFCTPGMILSAKALLDNKPHPTIEEVQHALSGNLCRCTGYYKPIEAVLEASKKMG